MILYTVVPVEDVLQEEEERPLVPAALGDCLLLVEPLGDGRGRIERVLATDPQRYLDPALQPGTVVLLAAGTGRAGPEGRER